MTVGSIIEKVRWCIDEESGYQDFEDTYMNNIIKAHVGDALRWCCMYGDASLLNGSSGDSTSGIVEDFVITVLENGITVKKGGVEVQDSGIAYKNGVLTLPSDFLKVARVRCSGWHQAITNPIAEDSEEYLMLYDETSTATKNRPQVALVETQPQRLELWPAATENEEIQLTILVNPQELSETASDTTDYGVPDKVGTAFLYYLAFLVLSAYNDTQKAQQMLGIAKMHLGQTTS